jgi:hypothetical protein
MNGIRGGGGGLGLKDRFTQSAPTYPPSSSHSSSPAGIDIAWAKLRRRRDRKKFSNVRERKKKKNETDWSTFNASFCKAIAGKLSREATG